VSETTSPTVSVRLPTVLRPQANGQSLVQQRGDTVGQVVNELVAAFPGLRANLLVNDEDIRFLQQLDTPVKEGDEVAILPAVAGG
jgi:molybdopterin synthase sulfur carrier subunit